MVIRIFIDSNIRKYCELGYTVILLLWYYIVIFKTNVISIYFVYNI